MNATCRVCGTNAAVELGEVEYVADYKWSVYECAACGCRFTRHDKLVHDQFHQLGAISYYAGYRDLMADTGRLFAAGDRDGLRGLLSATASKYRMVLDQVAQLPAGADCLEIGCSRGYLTSSLILDGINVLGVDVSAEAVGAARAAFGEHFALAGSDRAESGGPYDLIFHVGVIGCVADPLGLTRGLLAKLKPGGTLVFNSPNRDACVLPGQLWLDSAPPPDLVTLFPGAFWQREFGGIAEVRLTVEDRPPDESFRLRLARATSRRWCKPRPQPLAASEGGHSWQQPAPTWLERAAGKVARLTGLNRLVPRVPSDFGLFVTLKRR